MKPGPMLLALLCTWAAIVAQPQSQSQPLVQAPKSDVGALEVLVVVDQEDARSERLANLLKEHGVSPTLTTYAKVTKTAADAHDVVLADSKLFRKSRGALGQALKFPKTTTPIVAVGFLGTQLIERHGVAMTSGYI